MPFPVFVAVRRIGRTCGPLRDEGYGPNVSIFPWGWSVFDPVEVPQCMQRYSYRLPVGRTSNSRSLVGVATRQRGQYNSEAFNDPN